MSFFPSARRGRAPAAARCLPARPGRRRLYGNSASGAPSEALRPCLPRAAGPGVHPAPPSESPRGARPPPRRAQPEPRQKLEIKKEEEPGGVTLARPGSPLFQRGKKKKTSEKKGCRLEKLLFPPFRKGAENKLPVAASPPEFRGGSDTGLAAGGLRPPRGAQAEPA